jgi:hypothetical protein
MLAVLLKRGILLTAFALAVLWAAQLRDLSARLELAIGPRMPARVYLFKDGHPFRLSPVQALLPLKVDLFYRERLWMLGPSPETMEVTCNDQSHFLLLNGRASFDLPAGHYRVEAYRGLFYVPASKEFDLRAGETSRVELDLKAWTAPDGWLSGDDHIHLVRSRQDDPVFLRWIEAEDLSVANFLQLQRQADAATQYAFGRDGEARRANYSIRPGHESRSHAYGHVNLLGGRQLIRPLSTGIMYANSPEEYPFPALLFSQGRRLGATVGYAHFDGSQPHSTLLADLALGNIDFIEVFQFGILKTTEWYELLNAGLRVTGIAGSDFPVPLSRTKDWPRWLPLLGPERTLVKSSPGGDPYQAWAAGVRNGDVVVSNGPLVELELNAARNAATAKASFYRPLKRLNIIVNGSIAAEISGDGRRTTLTASVHLPETASCWVAAHVIGQNQPGEPEIQAHTNPAYVLRNGKPVSEPGAREALAARWRKEIDWYRSSLGFPSEREKDEFFDFADRALHELLKAPRP